MLRLHSPPFTVARLVANNFSSSSAVNANRAIIYTSNGSPSSVLSSRTFPSLPSPPPNTLNIKYLLVPINPADINVIEGVYPAKPSPTKLNNEGAVFVAGNEGLAAVTGVGSGVEEFKGGEWVVVGKQQSGTWRSGANVEVGDVIKVPKGASEVGAATIVVNYIIILSCANADVCMYRSIQRRPIICSRNLWILRKGTGSSRMVPIAPYAPTLAHHSPISQDSNRLARQSSK